MQIPSIPTPIANHALPQDVTAKAVPVMQAIAPLVQNPVVPSPKSEKFNEKDGSHDRNPRRRASDRNNREPNEKDGDDAQRGTNLNINV